MSTSYYYHSVSPHLCEETEMRNKQGPPHLCIIEQSATKTFRFRYETEIKSGGHGILSERIVVKLSNYEGDDAIIRCLLYTATDEPVPHVHQLLRKEKDKEIWCHEEAVSEANLYQAEFKRLSIVCKKKKDVVQALLCQKKKSLFEKLKMQFNQLMDNDLEAMVDAGSETMKLEAIQEAKNIDMDRVKLCFQAIVKGPHGDRKLCEVYSETIENTKSAEASDLKICDISHRTGSCKGGEKVFIIMKKGCKKDIKVRFYELNEENSEIWEDWGHFSDADVHGQVAIILRTPPYPYPGRENIMVKIELVKGDKRSKSEDFMYAPTQRNAKRCINCSSLCDSNSAQEIPSKRHHLITNADETVMESQSSSSLLVTGYLPHPRIDELNATGQSNEEPAEFDDEVMTDPQLIDFLENFIQLQTPSAELTHHNDCDIVTDGLQKRFSDMSIGKMRSPHLVQPDKQNKGDSANVATKAYDKLLQLSKSRHPSRREDMKNIIKAKGHYYGPLHTAVIHGQSKELSDIISLLTETNLLMLVNSPSQDNKTPLMVAVEENNLEALKLLFEAGADLSCTDYNGDNVFHIAAKFKHNECIEILQSRGLVKIPLLKVALDTKNDEGNTALRIAIWQNDLKSVKALVMAGADLNLKTSAAGQTPLDLAVKAKSKEIVEYLPGKRKMHLCETDFNERMAEDLVHSDQEELVSLFTMFHTGKVQDRKNDDAQNDQDKEKMGKGKDVAVETNDEEHDDKETDKDEDNWESCDEEVGNCEDSSPGNCENDSVATRKGESHECDNMPQQREDDKMDDLSLLDSATIAKLAQQLDDGERWKLLCKNLKLDFLIQMFAAVPSPTSCLIKYLKHDKKKDPSAFRAALKELYAKEDSSVLDHTIKKPNVSSEK